jgi:ketosteroid isomerase-like protein
LPSTDRVCSLIKRVEQQDYAGAVMHFYHHDATTQENHGEIRQGRDAILAHEMEVLLRYGNTPVRKVERFAVNGDLVFVNWQIEVNVPHVGRRMLDEVAMQLWSGDRIRTERFYYDPAQLRTVPT